MVVQTGLNVNPSIDQSFDIILPSGRRATSIDSPFIAYFGERRKTRQVVCRHVQN